MTQPREAIDRLQSAVNRQKVVQDAARKEAERIAAERESERQVTPQGEQAE